MTGEDYICPEPEFKKFVRGKFDEVQKCLNKKISWTMTGAIVAIFTAIVFLTYEAYSREQERQRELIKENCQEVQRLKTNDEVMGTRFVYLTNEIEKLAFQQEKNFDAILDKLETIQRKGGDRR